MATGGRPRRAMKPFPPAARAKLPAKPRKKELYSEEVLVWRMVQPAGSNPITDFFEGARGVTFGLMLPRCWVIMVGQHGTKLVDQTHQNKDEATATRNLFEWTELLEKDGAVMVVEPQTIRVVTGVETYEWLTVPEEWVREVLIPAVDAIETGRTV